MPFEVPAVAKGFVDNASSVKPFAVMMEGFPSFTRSIYNSADFLALSFVATIKD